MSGTPENKKQTAAALPAAYEPEWLEEVSSLRDVAIERAKSDSPEGTLLIAANQTNAIGSNNKPWQSFENNLHAAIILEPEIPEQRYEELLVVSLVSLGQAIAAEVAPMTALGYGDPNDITIARNKIASQWLDHGRRADHSPWLTITASVNIAHGPADFSLPAMSLHEAEGNSEITADTILIGWTRQLIGHLNDWADNGFDPVHAFWSQRLDDKTDESANAS